MHECEVEGGSVGKRSITGGYLQYKSKCYKGCLTAGVSTSQGLTKRLAAQSCRGQ